MVVTIILFAVIVLIIGFLWRFMSVKIDHSRYEFFVNKYQNAKREISEKAGREVEEAKMLLDKTSEPLKREILKSFIYQHKKHCLEKLISFFRYRKDDLTDKIDPLLSKVASKVVTEQKCSQFDIEQSFKIPFVARKIEEGGCVDRAGHIVRQLYDCGIIDLNYGQKDPTICLKDDVELKHILKKNKRYPLLPKQDKMKLNDFLFKEESDNIMEYTLAEVSRTESKENVEKICGDVTEDFKNVVDTFNSINSTRELPSDYQAHKNGHFFIAPEKDFLINFDSPDNSFNYMKYYYGEFASITFKNPAMDIYLYPDCIIVAKNQLDFDVVDYNDFSIIFERQGFVEKSDRSWSDNSKLIAHTEDNKLPVYEYGVLIFEPYHLVLQVENSQKAESFYDAFLTYKRQKERKILQSTSLINNGNRKTELTMENKNEFADLKFGATREYFDKAFSVTKPLCEFYDIISNDASVLQVADYTLPDEWGDKKNKLKFLLFVDLIKCYEQLGHDSTNLFSREGLPMAIVETYNPNISCTYQSVRQNVFIDIVEGICGINDALRKSLLNESSDDHFYLSDIFIECGNNDYSIKYFSILYKFFSVIAKADNNVTIEESKWLEKLVFFTRPSQHIKNNENDSYSMKGNLIEWKTKVENIEKEINDNAPINSMKTDPMDELQSLIGLSEVKKEVSALANFVKIQKEREKKGMKSVGISYHCVFTGNPGTGKTTVARIVANIYKEMGVLKKGHLVETDRSGLVAEYIGQTAVKTNKIIDSALDGVLFIDEAYSLIQGCGNDFGHEAISTLLKRMEDDRDRLVVIIAGYSKEIKDFVDSNPGLQSRFNRYINFSDYSAEELKQIFLLNVEKNQYVLEETGIEHLSKIMKYEVENKDKNFGNGRFVRNLFEKSIQNQAIRLSSKPDITTEDLSLLKAEDIPCINIEEDITCMYNHDIRTSILSLNTNQRILNALKSQKTDMFINEIRPETQILFCELDAEGYVKEIDGVLQPRHYDSLKLSTKNESCVFPIKHAEIELLTDNDGELISYEYKGEEYIKAQIVYYVG